MDVAVALHNNAQILFVTAPGEQEPSQDTGRKGNSRSVVRGTQPTLKGAAGIIRRIVHIHIWWLVLAAGLDLNCQPEESHVASPRSSIHPAPSQPHPRVVPDQWGSPTLD